MTRASHRYFLSLLLAVLLSFSITPRLCAQANAANGDDKTPSAQPVMAPRSLFAAAPSHRTPLSPDMLGLVCWNVQVGGVATSPSAERPPMVRDALSKIFAGTYQILAAQEISSTDNADVLKNMLPGGPAVWDYAFFDTTDTMDNGLWYRTDVAVGSPQVLFATSQMSSTGKIVTDTSRAFHPPIAAHVAIGDFDFTLIGVHFVYEDGNTEESAREMRVLLDYLDEYFKTPGHDPDLVLCGDFNIPSAASGQTGRSGLTLERVIAADSRFSSGERRLTVLVSEPTTRSSAAAGGLPVNNYDNIIISADVAEELLAAQRLPTDVLTDHPADPEERLTSDHFPLASVFRTWGPGVGRDLPFYSSIQSVVSSAAFRSGIVAGSWVSLFGRDLAPTARTWTSQEIVGDVLPAELDGVRVTIGGAAATMYYISPNQLNVQAPSDLPEGPTEVVVYRNATPVARFASTVHLCSPGFFLFQQGGNKYLAAVQALPENGGVMYVGRPDLFGGAVPARPVRPGDHILLFGTGFGPTAPPVPSGRVFVGAAPLTQPVRIRFGSREAHVLFAGLSGAGLYQFNVIVPDGLPSGDVPVVAEIQGVSTQANCYVTVE